MSAKETLLITYQPAPNDGCGIGDEGYGLALRPPQQEVLPARFESPGYVLTPCNGADFVDFVSGSAWYKDDEGLIFFQGMLLERGLVPTLLNGIFYDGMVYGAIHFSAGFGETTPFYIVSQGISLEQMLDLKDMLGQRFQLMAGLIGENPRFAQQLRNFCQQIEPPLGYLSRIVDSVHDGGKAVIFPGKRGQLNYARFLGCRPNRLSDAINRLILKRIIEEEGGRIMSGGRRNRLKPKG